jgi:hypothetical protein
MLRLIFHSAIPLAAYYRASAHLQQAFATIVPVRDVRRGSDAMTFVFATSFLTSLPDVKAAASWDRPLLARLAVGWTPFLAVGDDAS